MGHGCVPKRGDFISFYFIFTHYEQIAFPLSRFHLFYVRLFYTSRVLYTHSLKSLWTVREACTTNSIIILCAPNVLFFFFNETNYYVFRAVVSIIIYGVDLSVRSVSSGFLVSASKSIELSVCVCWPGPLMNEMSQLWRTGNDY